jgi:hypothetical protein
MTRNAAPNAMDRGAGEALAEKLKKVAIVILEDIGSGQVRTE